MSTPEENAGEPMGDETSCIFDCERLLAAVSDYASKIDTLTVPCPEGRMIVTGGGTIERAGTELVKALHLPFSRHDRLKEDLREVVTLISHGRRLLATQPDDPFEIEEAVEDKFIHRNHIPSRNLELLRAGQRALEVHISSHHHNNPVSERSRSTDVSQEDRLTDGSPGRPQDQQDPKLSADSIRPSPERSEPIQIQSTPVVILRQDESQQLIVGDSVSGELASIRPGTVAWAVLQIFKARHGEVIAARELAEGIDLCLAKFQSDQATEARAKDRARGELAGSERFRGTQHLIRARVPPTYSKMTDGNVVIGVQSILRSAIPDEAGKKWRQRWIHWNKKSATVTFGLA